MLPFDELFQDEVVPLLTDAQQEQLACLFAILPPPPVPEYLPDIPIFFPTLNIISPPVDPKIFVPKRAPRPILISDDAPKTQGYYGGIENEGDQRIPINTSVSHSTNRTRTRPRCEVSDTTINPNTVVNPTKKRNSTDTKAFNTIRREAVLARSDAGTNPKDEITLSSPKTHPSYYWESLNTTSSSKTTPGCKFGSLRYSHRSTTVYDVINEPLCDFEDLFFDPVLKFYSTLKSEVICEAIRKRTRNTFK